MEKRYEKFMVYWGIESLVRSQGVQVEVFGEIGNVG